MEVAHREESKDQGWKPCTTVKEHFKAEYEEPRHETDLTNPQALLAPQKTWELQE